MNYDQTIENIRGMLRDYLIQHPQLKSLVIGVSGGIDSALCCALARPVCDELNIPLIGRSLPILTNKKDERERAKLIGQSFCCDFEEKDLTTAYTDLRLVMPENGYSTIEDLIRLGNIKARIRMIYLYDIAQKNKGLVLSTDNWTEYLLGFWTIFGDQGDLGMVQELWKTEVYAISAHLASEYMNGKSYDNRAEALKLCIDAIATDGNGVSAGGDLEQFGVDSYDEVDRILKQWLKTKDVSLKDNPVVQRHERTHFKRNHPFNFPRTVISYKGCTI